MDYAERFISLFTCDWDLIDRALMSIGDYGQRERNKWRYQYASKGMQLAWDALFHRSANSGFEHTREILIALLQKAETFTNTTLQEIADEFMSDPRKKIAVSFVVARTKRQVTEYVSEEL